MLMFVTIIEPLAKEVQQLITSLGFKPRLYKILPKKDKYNYNRQILYHVRLSKDVQRFLNLIKPDKS